MHQHLGVSGDRGIYFEHVGRDDLGRQKKEQGFGHARGKFVPDLQVDDVDHKMHSPKSPAYRGE
jgi:hypothetical protein